MRDESLSSNSFARGDFWSGSSKTIFSFVCFFLVAISFFISFLLASIVKTLEITHPFQQIFDEFSKQTCRRVKANHIAYIDDFKRFFVGWTSEEVLSRLDSRVVIERNRLCLLFNIKR